LFESYYSVKRCAGKEKGVNEGCGKGKGRRRKGGEKEE
jgi:hypothetical protein